MPKKPTVIRHIEKEDLEKLYLKERDGRIKERLLTILELYEGKNKNEVKKVVRRGISTIKRWLKDWNDGGYDGLMPQFNGGPKSRMSESEWDKIIKEIEHKDMTLKDVKDYIKTNKGVEYSYKMVWYVMRKKKKMKQGIVLLK